MPGYHKMRSRSLRRSRRARNSKQAHKRKSMTHRRRRAYRKNTRRKHRKRRRNKRGGSDSQYYTDWLGASPDKYGPTNLPKLPAGDRTPDAWKTFYKQRATFFKAKCNRDKAGDGDDKPEYWKKINCDNVTEVLEHELDDAAE